MIILITGFIRDGRRIKRSGDERRLFHGCRSGKRTSFRRERTPCFERITSGSKTKISLSIERAFEKAFDRRRPSVSCCFGQTRRRSFELHRHEKRGGHAFEGQSTTERSEGNGTYGVDVRTFIRSCSSTYLLGSHVREGAECCVESRECRFGTFAIATTQLRDAEVEDLGALGSIGLSGTFNEDVAGLEIAMNDAGRVSSDESFEDVLDDRPDFGERQILLALESIGETFTFELFEDEQVGVIGSQADFEQATNVGALDRGRNFSFALKAANEIGFDCRSRKQHFDGDFSTISVVARSPNLSHAAAAKEAGYTVSR